jgi:hypothetical protein
MIENYRSELLWRLTRQSPYIVGGLRQAGFRGDWLEEPHRRPVHSALPHRLVTVADLCFTTMSRIGGWESQQ